MEIPNEIYTWFISIKLIPHNTSPQKNKENCILPKQLQSELLSGLKVSKFIEELGECYNKFYKMNLNYKDMIKKLDIKETNPDNLSLNEKKNIWMNIRDCLISFGLIYEKKDIQSIPEGNIELLKEIIIKMYSLCNEIMTPITQEEKQIKNPIQKNKREIFTPINKDKKEISKRETTSYNEDKSSNTTYTNISNISCTTQAVDISTIDTNKEYSKCETPLELFIVSLCKNFKINPKQATALLANNRKYLTILCSRGMKKSFENVIQWFKELSVNISTILSLIKMYNDGKQVGYATIGVGFYSRSIEVVSIANMIIFHIAKEVGVDWEWFANDGFYMLSFAIEKHKRITKELMRTLNSLTSGNYKEFVGLFIRRFTSSKDNLKHIGNFLFNIIPYLNIIGKNKEDKGNLFEEEVSKGIIELSLKDDVSDIPLRINLITQLWIHSVKGNYAFNPNDKNSILTFIKTNIRENNNYLTPKASCGIISMFKIMESLAVSKVEGGPLIYKSLVFLFLENYDNIYKRELFLNQFSNFFIQNQNVPIEIFLIPYLSQINRAKDYTICDFQFLFVIINHPRFKPEYSKSIIDFTLDVSINNLLFSRSANLILNLLFSTKLLTKKNEIQTEAEKKFTQHIKEIINLFIINTKSNINDKAILEIPYDIIIESFGNVNASVHNTIKWGVEEYYKMNNVHSKALLALLWFYDDHDTFLLQLEEKYSNDSNLCEERNKQIKLGKIVVKELKSNTNKENINDAHTHDNLRQSVELVLQKIKNEKEIKAKRKREIILKQKIKEEKIQKTLKKELAKKSIAMGVDQSHFTSLCDNSNITNHSNLNHLIQEEGSILKEKNRNNITALIRPTSKMKLNTLIDFNQYNFIVNINEEETREQKAIDGLNAKYKNNMKFLSKFLSNENGIITKSSILKYFREKNITNNEFSLDELSLCIRNCFGQNLNELNFIQFKSLLTTISYLIMTKINKVYTLSECYYKFLIRILPTMASSQNDINNKYKPLINYLRRKIDDNTIKDILLPPGCKIITKTDVIYKDKIPSLFKPKLTDSYIICIEILNDIFTTIFGRGILESFVKVKKYDDIDIDLGSVHNWSNELMIAYSKLDKQYEKTGIEIADCLEDALRKLCKGRDKMGNVIVSNLQKEKNEYMKNENTIKSKKEEQRLKRHNEIKLKVEMFKMEKEEIKKQKLKEKEQKELELKKEFHEMVIQSKKKNKKILEEINQYKKKKEEENLLKIMEQKEKEKENELKLQEEKNKFFKKQSRKLQEQFKIIKTQKENALKKKLEQLHSNQKLPIIQTGYLNKDKEYNTFDKQLIAKLEEILDKDEIKEFFGKYDNHLKVVYDIYSKLGQTNLAVSANSLYLNEYKEFLVNFTLLGILISQEQMNFIFKRITRKSESEGKAPYLTYDDFKLSFLFLNIYSRLTEKGSKINPSDLDCITLENLNTLFEFLGFKFPFERREVENYINERREMSAKEFFALQQKIKKEKIELFKGSNFLRNQSRPHSRFSIRSAPGIKRGKSSEMGKIKITINKKEKVKDNNQVKENENVYVIVNDEKKEKKKENGQQEEKILKENDIKGENGVGNSKEKISEGKDSSKLDMNRNPLRRSKSIDNISKKEEKKEKICSKELEHLKVINLKGEEEDWTIQD